MTHVLHCPCGYQIGVDGWLDVLELRRLHNRSEAHDAVVEVFTREWAQRLGMNT